MPFVKRHRTYYKYGTEPNANIVGSLTIDEGVVGGFSTANYLTYPKVVDVNGNWEALLKLRTEVTPPDGSILSFPNNNNFGCQLNVSGGKFLFVWNHIPGSRWDTYDTGVVIPVNKDVWVKYTKAGTMFKLYTSDDGLSYTEVATREYTASLYTPNTGFNLGGAVNNQNAWSGSIDLNESYIKINDKMWWRGTKAIEIPSSSITDFGSYKYYKNIVTTKYWKEITTGGRELAYACYKGNPLGFGDTYWYAKVPVGSDLTQYMKKDGSSGAATSVDDLYVNYTFESVTENTATVLGSSCSRYRAGDLYIDTTVTEVVEGTPEDYTYTTEETVTVEVTAEDDYDFTEFVPSTEYDYYKDGHKLYTPVLDEIKYYKHTYEDWEQPVLTSATSSKKVTITSTSDYGEGYYNWRVFDGGSTPWLSGNGTGQGSVRMQFPRPLKISKISVTGWSNPNGGTGYGAIYKDFNNTEMIGASQYFGGWVERVWTFDTPILTDKLSFYITGTGMWGCASEINITAQEQLVTETTEAEAEWSERIIKVY